MWNIAICEDDFIQQQLLHDLFNEIGLKDSINLHKFSSGEELIKSYENGNIYSIILLDMQLKDLNGIQTAKIIKQFDKECLFIIITSIIEYAVEGYSIDAFDFILKPVSKDKFSSAVNNAIKELQRKEKKIYLIKSRDKLTSVRLSEIKYVESNKNKVIIHTNDELYIDNDSISNVEKKLINDRFIRISRYYIVNIYHIKEIHVNRIVLVTGEELIYSNKYRESIKNEYISFMTGDI